MTGGRRRGALTRRLRRALPGRVAQRARPRTVSVVINTLDRSRSLRRALHALREQTFRRFEVVVVNGPSRDDTDAMLAEFDGQIRVAHCAEACLGASRNIGVELAAGEVVAFLDDDAVPDPRWLAALVEGFADADVGGVGGPVFDTPLDEVVWDLCTATRRGQVNLSSEGPPARYLVPGADPFLYLPGANMSFRRQALVDAGGFNGRLRFNYDDVEICARVIDRGHRLAILPTALVRHDRAPNAAREDPHRILDPYLGVYCHLIFVLQCEGSVWTREERVQAVEETVAAMLRAVDGARQGGTLSEARHAAFATRARAAIADGLADGARPRETVALGPPREARFLPYGP